jgi:hypothetical protein
MKIITKQSQNKTRLSTWHFQENSKTRPSQDDHKTITRPTIKHKAITRQHKTRQHTTQHNTTQHNKRQHNTTTQDNTRQNNTQERRQDTKTARQDKARQRQDIHHLLFVELLVNCRHLVVEGTKQASKHQEDAILII